MGNNTAAASTPTLTLPRSRGRTKVGAGVGDGLRINTRNPQLVKYARKLRIDLTPWERKLWYKLNHDQLGFRFRRQQTIGNYIVDFYCVPKKLIIEIDGGQHNGNLKDIDRDKFLRSNGCTILRFWNNEVEGNLDGVLVKIAKTLAGYPHPTLPLERGRSSLSLPPPLAGEDKGGGRS